jgi:hypothetical protein
LLSIVDVREPVNVCYRRKSGKHLLALSISQFDPQRKSTAAKDKETTSKEARSLTSNDQNVGAVQHVGVLQMCHGGLMAPRC